MPILVRNIIIVAIVGILLGQNFKPDIYTACSNTAPG